MLNKRAKEQADGKPLSKATASSTTANPNYATAGSASPMRPHNAKEAESGVANAHKFLAKAQAWRHDTSKDAKKNSSDADRAAAPSPGHETTAQQREGRDRTSAPNESKATSKAKGHETPDEADDVSTRQEKDKMAEAAAKLILSRVSAALRRQEIGPYDCFRRLDVEARGEISCTLIQPLVHAFQPDASIVQTQQVFNLFDIHRKGVVTAAVFASVLDADAILRRVAKALTTQLRTPEDLYDMLDVAGSGRLVKSHLDAFIRAFDADTTEETLTATFHLLQSGQPPCVVVEDFSEALLCRQKSHYTNELPKISAEDVAAQAEHHRHYRQLEAQEDVRCRLELQLHASLLRQGLLTGVLPSSEDIALPAELLSPHRDLRADGRQRVLIHTGEEFSKRTAGSLLGDSSFWFC
eukprot:TRINITY_DN8500_c0_g1_i10.p1 TRINITY_DN8500_c0_g1~~TRINITY_DN8500_c0_g1_i10.p1  ORF type:complete len:411 (+),score=49.75 TRINITY_DN8500_c0_g1_i10:279-1511(+)